MGLMPLASRMIPRQRSFVQHNAASNQRSKLWNVTYVSVSRRVALISWRFAWLVWFLYSQTFRLLPAALLLMMGWFGAGASTVKTKRSPMTPLEKFNGFHDLAKEALEHAYQADVEGQRDRAIKLYNTGLQAISEGLSLQVQGSGLGPKADNVSSLRYDMEQWQQQSMDRLRHLESNCASTSGPAPQPFKPGRSISAAFRCPAGAGPAAAAAGYSQPAQFRRAPTLQRQPSPVLHGDGAKRLSSGGGAQQLAPAGSAKALTKEEERLRELIMGEILDRSPHVSWDDIAGLETAKQALNEAVVLPSLRADIFQGLRSPVRGILLYGPPGNGKTMLGRALASEAKATFFNISASSLTSKWVGEGEKLVRALFQVAAEHQPAIIFMDEVDSILSARSANDNDAMRRLKTEFLVQFDGVAGGGDRVVVVGATNRPQELDDAARRRLAKRIYIPLPDANARYTLLKQLLKGVTHALVTADMHKIARSTADYSGSDLKELCKEAAMGPIRELKPGEIQRVKLNSLRPLQVGDFQAAYQVIKPSVNKQVLQVYEDFTREYGTQ